MDLTLTQWAIVAVLAFLAFGCASLIVGIIVGLGSLEKNIREYDE